MSCRCAISIGVEHIMSADPIWLVVHWHSAAKYSIIAFALFLGTYPVVLIHIYLIWIPILQTSKRLKSWIRVDIQTWCGVLCTRVITQKFLLTHFVPRENELIFFREKWKSLEKKWSCQTSPQCFFLAEPYQGEWFAAPLQHRGRSQDFLSNMVPMLFPVCIWRMKWLPFNFIICS